VEELRWTVRVRDRRGRPHRGIALYTSRVPASPPEPPAQFQIALLSAARAVRRLPPATAVCVPRLAKRAATPSKAVHPTIAQLKKNVLPPEIHAQLAAGSIIHLGGELPAPAVFAQGVPAFDLERLALLLVEQAHADALAPYTAIIRRELQLPAGTDVVLALQTRLAPADVSERPPARAPGTMRLHRALRALEGGDPPASTLEQLTDDLRFLRLFERQDHVLKREALDRLLGDVMDAPSARRTSPATVVPLRAPRERKAPGRP
jgi:hypothetical protein